MRGEVKKFSFLHSEDNVEKFWTDFRDFLTKLIKKVWIIN